MQTLARIQRILIILAYNIVKYLKLMLMQCYILNFY